MTRARAGEPVDTLGSYPSHGGFDSRARNASWVQVVLVGCTTEGRVVTLPAEDAKALIDRGKARPLHGHPEIGRGAHVVNRDPHKETL